ncbi:hypothetical protein [Roseibium sp.]|uniref:hypothetical protein n=1 Tax=Roseibium sp. TaxID=1936156 RepID=UPI003BB1578D
MQLYVLPTSVNGLLTYLIVSLVVSFVLIALFQLFGKRTRFRSKSVLGSRASRYLALLIITMAFLGTAVGMAGGWSRVGVVGDIIPAVLGLIGGITVYLFENKGGKGVAAVPAALAFTITVFIGYQLGTENRNPTERAQVYRDMCFSALSNPELLSSDEAYCRFIDGPGQACWEVLFHNNMTFLSDARYGDATYLKNWYEAQKRQSDQKFRNCLPWKKEREEKMLKAAS